MEGVRGQKAFSHNDLKAPQLSCQGSLVGQPSGADERGGPLAEEAAVTVVQADEATGERPAGSALCGAAPDTRV